MAVKGATKKEGPHHGTIYQMKLLFLYLKRGLDDDYEISLGTEITEAGCFDDLVIKIIDKNGDIKCRFLQSKHTIKDKSIGFKDLALDKNGPFYLPKYFGSYCSIQKNPIFDKDSEMKFIIWTNWLVNTDDLKGKIHLEEIKPKDDDIVLGDDELLKYPNAKLFKIVKFEQKVEEKMLRQTDFYKLAYQLFFHSFKNNTAEFTSELFKCYRLALTCDKIINKTSNKFHVDFVDKNCNLSGLALEFRETIIKIAKLENFWENEESFYKTLTATFFNRPYRDGHSDGSKNNFIKLKTPSVDLNDFLNRFIFAIGQPNEKLLDAIIKNELNDKYELIDSQFMNDSIMIYILDWLKDTKKTFVTRCEAEALFKDIEQKLAFLKLKDLKNDYECYCKDKSLQFHIDNLESLKSDIESSHQISEIQTDCITLTTLKVFQILQNSEKYKNGDCYIVMKYSFMVSRTDLVKKAFNKDGCVLLVIEFDRKLQESDAKNLFKPLINIVKKHQEKKIVFITESDQQLSSVCECNQFKDANNFSSLSVETRKVVQERQVDFQGQKVVFQDLLISTCSEMSALSLTSKILLKLIDNTEMLKMGQPIVSVKDTIKWYIPRIFVHKFVIGKEFLNSSSKIDDIFLIYGQRSVDEFKEINNTEVSIFKEFITKRVSEEWQCDLLPFVYVPCDNQKALSIFEMLVSNFPNSNVHLVKAGKGEFLWQKSSGSVEGLKNFLTTKEFSETEMSCDEDGERLIIVVASPGMGKSIVLANLSHNLKEKYPRCWVILIKLDKFQKDLKDMTYIDLETTLNFISNCEKLSEDMEKQLLLNSVQNSNRCFILFDAFDEISTKAQYKVIQMIRILLETKIRQIWLASRPHLQAEIEESFHTMSFDVKPLSKYEQGCFLQNYWKHAMPFDGGSDIEVKLNTFISSVIKQFSATTRDVLKTFIGVPLHTEMLAQVLKDKCIEFCSSSVEYPKEMLQNMYCNLFGFYKCFMEFKFRNFQEKSGCGDLVNKHQSQMAKSHRKQMSEMHGQLAFLVLFPHNSVTDLSFQELDLNEMLSCGIMQQTEEDGVHFVHKTFAEFWASNFVATQLQKSKGLHDFVKPEILKESNALLKVFLDGHLATDKLHQKVLSGDISIKDLNEANLNVQDQQGRTPLHLASSYNHTDSIKILLELKPDLDAVDKLFLWTPLQYAIETLSWESAVFLVMAGSNVRGLHDKQLEKILWHSCNCPNDDTLQSMSKMLRVLNDQNEKIKKLLFCSKHSEVNSVHPSARTRLIKDISTMIESDQNTCSGAKQSRAIKFHHCRVIQNIIEHTSGHCLSLNLGHYALHLAAEEECTEMVTSIINLFLDNPDQLAHLIFAVNSLTVNLVPCATCQGFKIMINAVMEQLIGKPEHIKQFIFSTDSDGNNLLHCAAQNGFVESANVLMIWLQLLDQPQPGLLEEIIFSTNHKGENPLHLATFSGSTETVNAILNQLQEKPEKLIELIFAENCQRKTSMHYAADKSSAEMVNIIINILQGNSETLMELITSLDVYGNTPLHSAAEVGSVEPANAIMNWVQNNEPTKLEELIFSVNLSGETPFLQAVFSGSIDTVSAIMSQLQNESELVEKLVFDVNCIGENSLHKAAYGGATDSLNAFINQLQDGSEHLIELTSSVDCRGKSSLHYAAKEAPAEVASAMMNQRQSGPERRIRWIFSKDNCRNIPLNLATLMCQLQSVSDQLEDKPELLQQLIQSLNPGGENPLHRSEYKCSPESDMRAAQMLNTIMNTLQDKPKKLIKLLLSVDCFDNVPLHIAARIGCTESVNAILNRAQVDLSLLNFLVLLPNSEGENSLHCAVLSGSTDTFNAIINRLQDNDELVIFSKNKKNENLVHHAVLSGSVDVLNTVMDWLKTEHLIELISLVNCDGKNSLHYAANKKSVEMVCTIMNRLEGNPAQLIHLICSLDSEGNNPLHIAAHKGCTESVNVIMSHLQDRPELLKQLISSVNSKGETSLHLAAYSGCNETVIVIMNQLQNEPEHLENLILLVNATGSNVLHYAAENGNDEMVSAIMNRLEVKPE